MGQGIRPHEADMMDLTTVATMLGVSARSSSVSSNGDTPAGLKPPSWWTGDDDAAESSIEAARQMGFAVGNIG